MPYKDPERRRAAQRQANARFAAAHPERLAAAKAAWYEKNRATELERMKRYKKNHPEVERRGYLSRKYGVTPEQYGAMLAAQGGVCAICGGSPVGRTKGGPARWFDVDHDHATGKVRGLLCHPCNAVLGYARDRVDVLRAAAAYLTPQS